VVIGLELPGYNRATECNNDVLRLVAIRIVNDAIGAAVDANEAIDPNYESGFLPRLAHGCVGRALIGLNEPAWRRPRAIVALPYQEQTAGLVEHVNADRR
jgi:hypothetical protein